MSNLDKEPEVQSYLNKEYNDDATKRIDITKEATQPVEKVEEPIEKKLKKANDKVKKEKKPVTMKKIILTRVLFIIIFAAIVMGLTIYFANKTKVKGSENKNSVINNVTDSNKENNEATSNNEKTVDLNGTYYINPIDFRTYTFEVLGNEIEYVQIDGLKDDGVEIKINNEIKESIEELSKKICEENESAEIYSGYTIRGNFANVISINFSISAINDENDVYEDLYFNYDLVNGNEIKLDDIFTSDFPMEEVLIDKLYEAVTTEFTTMDEDTWNLYVAENAEDIEEIVYSIVSDYQRGKKIDFCFTPKLLEVSAGQYSSAKILFKDYTEYVTIYDKYLTSDSLYDGMYKAIEELPNLTDLSMWANFEEYIEEEGDNYYINVGLFAEEDTPEKILDSIKNYMNNYINEKKIEEREDGIFTIYNATFDLWYNEVDNIYSVNIQDISYNTTKSKYTHSIKNEIIEFFREDFSESPEFIGNSFLSRLNYYDEVINYELLESEYYNVKLDTIGNIITINGVPVSLETID